MKITNLLLALGLTTSIASCTVINNTQNSATRKADIRKLMEEQTVCWSNGDLECFMETYWQSDSLLFVGKSGLTYGWQQTLANYKRSYPDASAMGKLTFDLKEMRPLSPENILVVGKWHLKRTIAAGDLEGHFSVIFKRYPGRDKRFV